MRPCTVNTASSGSTGGGGAEAQRAALDAPAVGAARERQLRPQPLTERHAQLRAGCPRPAAPGAAAPQPPQALATARAGGWRPRRGAESACRVQRPGACSLRVGMLNCAVHSALPASVASASLPPTASSAWRASSRPRAEIARLAAPCSRRSPTARLTGPPSHWPVRLERCRRPLAKASVPCCTWIGGTPATGYSRVPSSTAVTRTRGGARRCAASLTSTSSSVAPERSMPCSVGA